MNEKEAKMNEKEAKMNENEDTMNAKLMVSGPFKLILK